MPPPGPGAGTPTGYGNPVIPTPTQQPIAADNSHQAFLLLLGQAIGVLIAAWVSSMSDNVGTVVIAILVVLWLIWIMNRSDIVQQWGAKVGL